MYTDKDYYIKDRFREEKTDASLKTLHRSPPITDDSQTDTNISEINNVPPGLEPIINLSKLYLMRRLEIVQSDPLGKYTAEILNEDGNRLFLITTSIHSDSDEVIEYGKMKKMKLKGKICYGVINYAGHQVFEIHGDPEKVIRIGPNSAIWGEIQIMQSPMAERRPLFHLCCCCCKRMRKDSREDGAEIRVVIFKKNSMGEEKKPPYYRAPLSFKHVYTLRGHIYGGCCRYQDSIFYTKSFDFAIFPRDSLAADPGDTVVKTDKSADNVTKGKSNTKDKKASYKSIGRLCSSEHHKKLDCYLPLLELPPELDVYDKISLMGTFFLFHLS